MQSSRAGYWLRASSGFDSISIPLPANLSRKCLAEKVVEACSFMGVTPGLFTLAESR